MKSTIGIFLCALCMLSACLPNQTKQSPIAIMAYYVPSDEYTTLDHLDFDQLTHIIFSFTEVIDNQMKFVNPQSADQLRRLVNQKAEYPDLKVMIACGGWGGSGGFSNMADTPEERQRFVSSVIDFIDQYKLDGLDIDWEYPGLPGADNPHKPEDKENFTTLMKELRMAMDATGKKLELTFAAAGWEHFFHHVEISEVMKYANYMNVMTYDLVGGASPFTGHHTNLGRIEMNHLEGTPAKAFLDSIKKDYSPRSSEKIISYCIEQGVDARQIVIGAAFYGRGWHGVPFENKGLYQPTKGVWQGWASYAKIRENYENKNGFTRYWDPIAKAPYLYNSQDSVFISYDDTMSVRLKTQYAKEMKLGGIMFWQISLDTPEDGLLDAIYKEAIRK